MTSLQEGSFSHFCHRTGLEGKEAFDAWNEEATLRRQRIAESAGFTGATALEQLHVTSPVEVVRLITRQALTNLGVNPDLA